MRASALLALLATAALAQAERPGPPNVLFILSDDQRPDTIAALGNPVIRTPNLDALVRRGMVFTRAASPDPVCVPSRAEILTGCNGFRNGVAPGYGNALREGLTLWPEAMRAAGYHTWHVGKWHVAGRARPGLAGYEESLGLFKGGAGEAGTKVDQRGMEITGYRGWVFQTEDGRKFPEKGIGLTAETSVHMADAAIEFIRRKSDRPFFLQVNFAAPHDPLVVPPGYEKMYDPAKIPLPPSFQPRHPFDHGNAGGRDENLLPLPRTPGMIREELAAYYAVITQMDAQIGRILAALEAAGRAGNTIVVFSSDQGVAIGSHGLRGKQNMYEHTVGVPLIIAASEIPPGRNSDAQVYLRDLFPTVCELAGVPVPKTVEARSFAAVLRGGARSHHAAIFGHFTDTQRMVRTDRWKLIRYPKAGVEQLFDLANDPHELRNLAEEAGLDTVRAELRARLEAWQKEVGDPLASR